MEISEAITDIVTPGGTQMPANLLKAAGKAAIGAAGAAGAWALNKLRRKQPPNDPPPNEPGNGKLHLKYLGDYYSTSHRSRKYAMPRGSTYARSKSKSRKRYSRLSRLKNRDNFINFYKRSNFASTRPVATVVMHTSCYFNWNDQNISGTSAEGRFLPAVLRGDQYGTSGSTTYGLPSWWFIQQAREWTQVKALYEEIKPVKQYFTIRVVGAASDINKTTGVSAGTPVDGNEYWKFMVNSDFLAPRNIDSDSGIWQDKRVEMLIKDSSTKFSWIQPAAFGTVGGGMGQATPPTVRITNGWPTST